ncbi:hypothetical protein BJ944DRAFT_174553 [Cunninghamella echinulata]|nr:hypothetical protein BJ944DRAFT_174553 [Cunninghamella echinulata]
MKVLNILIITLLFNIFSHAYVIPSPTPINLSPSKSINIKPTDPPQHHNLKKVLGKRELQATLSLYQFWANVCNGRNDNNKDVQVSAGVSIDPNIRQFWKTVTETVNCGNGKIKTVTTTITATATATATVTDPGYNKPPECDSQCWSDYLWHTYGYGISVAQAFTGIVCMLIGIYFMIFGYHFFRPTLGLTGFVFFAVMTWIGLTNNEPATGYQHAEILYICVSAGLGLLGAGMGMFFFNVTIYLIGALAGFYLSVWLLSWKASLLITVKVAQICFIIGVGAVAGVSVYLLETYIIILATSFTGAYLVLFGLDFFAHTGMLNAWLLIFDANPNHYNAYMIQKPVLVMLSFVAVFFLAATGWQYYWNQIRHKRNFGVNLAPKKEEK